MNFRNRNNAVPKAGRVDPLLLVLTILLAGIGVVMVYSASFVRAEQAAGSGIYFMKRQLVFLAIGVLVMLSIGRVNYHFWSRGKVPYILFGGTMLLLLLTFIPPFGREVAGTHRWLVFPARFQPGELAKVATVIILAFTASRLGERISELKQGVAKMVIWPAAFIVIIHLEKDLGTCVVIAAITGALIYIAGGPLKYILATGGAVTALGAVAILTQGYRMARIMTFLEPWKDTQGKGYQIVQSLIAFGSGGVTGLGLGKGKQKLFYLPAAHTDFIMANIAEELGMIGVWAIIALFSLLLYRAFRVAMKAPDRFGMLLAAGISCLLSFHVVINIMVVMSLLPNKGLTLPFISYGGSSMLVNFFMMGLLLSVSRWRGACDEHGEAPCFGEVAR